ncbi:hypothetical protein CLF_103198 [Clonorchis sinensis]|uniref:EGF-like domain-containing protein n=1 Tax=Clonorchis sinensis TaxID=79923 RepID=G7Y9B3_CLOSI|nr:hypothetical protein CLF_103198 [Clonorchis sinensis]
MEKSSTNIKGNISCYNKEQTNICRKLNGFSLKLLYILTAYRNQTKVLEKRRLNAKGYFTIILSVKHMMLGFREIWALLLIIHSTRQSSSANDSAEVKMSIGTTIPPVSTSNLSTVTEKNNFVLQRINLTSDPSIFPICIPACTNGGVCRRAGNDVSPRCLCPLDYEGEACEKRSHTHLKEKFQAAEVELGRAGVTFSARKTEIIMICGDKKHRATAISVKLISPYGPTDTVKLSKGKSVFSWIFISVIQLRCRLMMFLVARRPSVVENVVNLRVWGIFFSTVGLCIMVNVLVIIELQGNSRNVFVTRGSRAYEVSMRLVQLGQPMEWDTAFDDSSSTLYQETVSKILRLQNEHCAVDQNKDAGCDSCYDIRDIGSELRYRRTYLLYRRLHQSVWKCFKDRISFGRFVSGSVVASVFIKFDFNDSMAKTYDNKVVLEHLISGGMRLSESSLPAPIPSLIIFERQDAAVFSVQATDPCSSGNNDCSVNGICVPLSGTVYTCECKTFTIDVSPNGFYPGRRCIYDGLIILTFVVVGLLLSMLIFVLCGCRRTIWYRYRNRREAEHVTLVKMAANYDI